jgi:hypothetical protein
MSPLPEYFTNMPTTWFQQAEARFAAARPSPTNCQKFFHLLAKLPQDVMVNFTDLITECTLAAADNNGDPYKTMKDAILEFTQKPKWSCYLDLHTLPPQGDIRPSHLMAKLINMLPHGVKPDNYLFYSFYMFRMPQKVREVLALTDYPNARAMAAAANRVWDLRQSVPPTAVAAVTAPCERSHSPRNNNRNNRDNQRRRSPSHCRGQARTPHNTAQEFDNGICWYHNKFQHKSTKCTPPPCQWQGNAASSR